MRSIGVQWLELTAASQQEGLGFEPYSSDLFGAEFACSPPLLGELISLN